MRRRWAPPWLFVCVLTAAALSSCKREVRGFRVLPVAAQQAVQEDNTPFHPGGELRPALADESSTAPSRDIDINAYNLSQGQQLFEGMNCAGCHASHGGGGIGPALMDDRWIYGWQPQVIFDTVAYGRPNGMPAFGRRLSEQQVWQLVAYVRSLSGFASEDAAPGRSDHLFAAAPPNSMRAPTPRSSTFELAELRTREQLEFQARGWIDPQSGHVRVPESVVQAIAGRRSTTTHVTSH